MLRRTVRGTLVAAVAALTLLTGCSSSGNTQPTTSKELHYGLFNAPKTFAAAKALWSESSLLMQALYDTVLTQSPDDTISPGLATKWVYNDTKTALTLTIRDGVKFADGSTITPQVVANNLQHFTAAAGPNANSLASVNKVTVAGQTVVITLKEKDPSLLTSLAQGAGLVENPAAFTRADYSTVPDGSGPYRLDAKSTVLGSSYRLVKNASYWNPAVQHFDAISINIYTDPTALTNAALGHQLDAANLSPKNDTAALEKAGYSLKPNELNWTGISLFDRDGKQTPALKDVRVRQAINYAINRPALLKALAQNQGTVTEQVFPKFSAGFDPALDNTYPYDPAKARQLLQAAGLAGGFSMDFPTSTALASAAFTIIQQEMKDIGITLNLRDTGTNFISDVLAPKYSVAYLPLQQGTDWELYNFLFSPTATFNPFHSNDPKVQAWGAVLRDGPSAAADKAAKELNAYIVQQAWFVPWFRQPLQVMVDPKKVDLTVQRGSAVPSLAYIIPVGQ